MAGKITMQELSHELRLLIEAEAPERNIEMQEGLTHIQWKYVEDENWIDLIAIDELKGEPGIPGQPGDDGLNGREIELQKGDTHIQWKYFDMPSNAWIDLVALEDLKGDPGTGGGDFTGEITAENGDVLLDTYGINSKFLDNFKNLIWNSSFEVIDDNDNNRPKFWRRPVLKPGANSTANSSFYSSRSLHMPPGSQIEQDRHAGQYLQGLIPKGIWYGNKITMVSLYVNFFNSNNSTLAIRVKSLEGGDAGVNTGIYYELTDVNDEKIPESTNTELRFKRKNVDEVSWGRVITFTFNPNDITGIDSPQNQNAWYLEFENVGTSDLYIDGVMAHPDFTGKWSQLYKDGPQSLSFKDIGDAWSIPINELEESKFEFTPVVASLTEPVNKDILWFDLNDLNITGDIANITMYDNGMIVEYDAEISHDYSFEKDVDGKITKIVNNSLNTETNIAWPGGNKP